MTTTPTTLLDRVLPTIDAKQALVVVRKHPLSSWYIHPFLADLLFARPGIHVGVRTCGPGELCNLVVDALYKYGRGKHIVRYNQDTVLVYPHGAASSEVDTKECSRLSCIPWTTSPLRGQVVDVCIVTRPLDMVSFIHSWQPGQNSVLGILDPEDVTLGWIQGCPAPVEFES